MEAKFLDGSCWFLDVSGCFGGSLMMSNLTNDCLFISLFFNDDLTSLFWITCAF